MALYLFRDGRTDRRAFHDGRDGSQPPARHFINSLLFIEAINIHKLSPQWDSASLCDTRCAMWK